MWLQLDGAPPHATREAVDVIRDNYPDRWIGRGSSVPWPPRSPDLTPLDFFLWGYVRSLVYETPVESEEDLVARIIAAFEKVQNQSGIFENVRNSMLRRCETCIAVQGRHFEHLL